jgi:hypothetical protein
LILTALSCVTRFGKIINRSEPESEAKVSLPGNGLSAANSACSPTSSDLLTDWQIKTANVSDREFLPLVEDVRDKMIVLADKGFRRQKNQPENLKICSRGEWNDRMLVETVFSLLSQVCKLKHLG